MSGESVSNIRPMVYASLFSALTAVGAFLSIPIGPVPIVLQNFFVMLAALVLGPGWGLASILVYLLAGAAGLPVFSGGSGGIGRFIGPTGGFLIGYIPYVFLIGFIAKKGGHRVGFEALGIVAGSVMLYGLGVSWLTHLSGLSFGKALALGMYPFLPGDAIKAGAAIALARALRPVVHPDLSGSGHGPD